MIVPVSKNYDRNNQIVFNVDIPVQLPSQWGEIKINNLVKTPYFCKFHVSFLLLFKLVYRKTIYLCIERQQVLHHTSNLQPFLQTYSQDVVNPSSPILYISTLDGTFYALDAATGIIKWKIKEDKVVNVPDAFQENQKFFPDPLDGSLYIVNRGNIEVSFMGQLVPCKIQLK